MSAKGRRMRRTFEDSMKHFNRCESILLDMIRGHQENCRRHETASETYKITDDISELIDDVDYLLDGNHPRYMNTPAVERCRNYSQGEFELFAMRLSREFYKRIDLKLVLTTPCTCKKSKMPTMRRFALRAEQALSFWLLQMLDHRMSCAQHKESEKEFERADDMIHHVNEMHGIREADRGEGPFVNPKKFIPTIEVYREMPAKRWEKFVKDTELEFREERRLRLVRSWKCSCEK